jgi:hypothetical protein
MTRISRYALFGAILVWGAALAAAGSASGQDGSLSRPLHLPRMTDGARCPASVGQLASKLGRGLARIPAAGAGPVYMLSVADEPAGAMTIEDSRADPQGWRGQKAPWIAAPRYRGPILIRGARIDAPGEVRFARDEGDHAPALYQRRGQSMQPNGWRVWPGSLLVRAPGCYALQVDGASFSAVIVVRVHG